jgi:AraC-like DNA-binding protein
MAPDASYLCGLATAVFITTGVVVAMVRWFHMCRPYGSNPDYYYPARPFVTGIFLSTLLLLPYALHPESEDAWHLTQMYFLPVSLYNFTLMLYAYFGNVMRWRKWRRPILIVGCPIVISLIAAEILAIIPGDHVTLISHVNLLILGGVMTWVCLGAMGLVYRWARQFNEDDFSNPNDFPVTFARRWLLLILVNMCLSWAAALADTKLLMAVVMLLFSVSAVMLVIMALHPHRTRPVEEEEMAMEEESEADAQDQMYNRSMPQRKRKEILAAIRSVVEEQQAFLEPHLTLQNVADRCGYNRSYISGLIKAEYGGFFAYVNGLRVAHVDTWLQEHPAGTIQEAIDASGFCSRQGYYSVKTRLENNS